MTDEWHDPLLSRARELRRSMTPQERKLWYCFLKEYPVKIYKQKIIGPFIVDFYCHAAQLVIELDGPVHHSGAASARDDERTALLMIRGLKILHIENEEIDDDFPEQYEFKPAFSSKEELREQYLNQSFDKNIPFENEKRKGKGKRFK